MGQLWIACWGIWGIMTGASMGVMLITLFWSIGIGMDHLRAWRARRRGEMISIACDDRIGFTFRVFISGLSTFVAMIAILATAVACQ